EGGVNYYPFGYQEYSERENYLAEAKTSVQFVVKANAPMSAQGMSERDRKEKHSKEQNRIEQNRKNQNRMEQEIKKLERQVEETERRMDEIRSLMESPEFACDYTKLSELNDQLMDEERRLEEYLENYVSYQE
ncbi:MAG: transporter C-terminal domain, partial [Firmicutes bacterium]|nr:transporter C-terminal domain [Bacillota bacterium]